METGYLSGGGGRKMKKESILKKMTHMLPDTLYLQLQFIRRMRHILHIKNPQTFSEKLQWLKLHDRKPAYTEMVDKYAAKRYVGERIGYEYIVPLLGVWNSFDEIDFDLLPDKFVLKCTHDSGGIIICRDKSKFDAESARKRITECLAVQPYWHGREWPYLHVQPRVLAEKYLEDANSQGLLDYKFYCFHGEPKFLYVACGLENRKTAQISYVSLDWTRMPFCREDHEQLEELPRPPVHFQEMIAFARKLSENIPFLRVDFYEVNGAVYFGELTFFPSIGMSRFEPEEWDRKIGEWLDLDIVKGENTQ